MNTSLVLPALYDPEHVIVSEAPLRGARIWVDTARRRTMLPLIPDLSCDVLLTPAGPVLTTRTVTLTPVVMEARTTITGLRLPIAATHVRMDCTWPGWHMRCAAEERLEGALADGTLAWREDADVSTWVESLHMPFPSNIARIATTTPVSERTLRRRMDAALGVSPVRVRRILRLHRLASLLQHQSIASAVADAGYVDQPHAARDVRALTGLQLRRLAQFRLAD